MKIITKTEQLNYFTIKAKEEWELALNDKVFNYYTINIKFGFPKSVYQIPKENKYKNAIIERNEKFKRAKGICISKTKKYHTIYIKKSKCKNEKEIYRVLMHELGHTIGIEHPIHKYPCIMQSKIKNSSKELNTIDLLEYKKYGKIENFFFEIMHLHEIFFFENFKNKNPEYANQVVRENVTIIKPILEKYFKAIDNLYISEVKEEHNKLKK